MLFFYLGIYFSCIAALLYWDFLVNHGQQFFISKKRFLIRFLIILISLAIDAIILVKGYEIYRPGAFIEEEIISPAYVTQAGVTTIERFFREERTKAQRCSLNNNSCASPEELIESNIITLNWDFLNSDQGAKENARQWLKANDLIPSTSVLYRGRFIHHYNTILHPIRELLGGNYAAALTSQYGGAALLPIFLLRNNNFAIYGIGSLVLVLAAFNILIAILLFKKVAFKRFVVLLVIVLVAAMDLNEGALRINPGFAFYRFVPILVITFVFIRMHEFSSIKVLPIIILCLLLNSIQFNLLFCAMVFSYITLNAVYENKKINFEGLKDELTILFVAAAISGAQIFLVYSRKSEFTAPLFGSLGESHFDLIYAASVSIFPIILLLLKRYQAGRLSLDHSERFSYIARYQAGWLSLDHSERFSYIAYGFLSLYPISFPGSPQHYCGFLFASSFVIYTLATKSCNGRPAYLAIFITSLFFPSWYFSYGTWPSPLQIEHSTIYQQKLFGAQLQFAFARNIEALEKQFEDLAALEPTSRDNTYFISKDKIYFELKDNKNYLPYSYDAFANAEVVPLDKLWRETKHNNIKYLVLDSTTHVENMKALLAFVPYNIQETKSYLALIEQIEKIRRSSPLSEIRCSVRYCLYKIGS